jgi:CRISPR/Cas system-associated endonuclease Cas1
MKCALGYTKKYPLFETEIGEVILQSGNMVSTGALTACGFWGIDVLITTRAGRPIAVLKNLEDDAGVETRIAQYKALENGKGAHIAKQIVLGKILSQNHNTRRSTAFRWLQPLRQHKQQVVFLRRTHSHRHNWHNPHSMGLHEKQES